VKPDHFALLDQLRRPWLDDAALKDAFHRATAQCHPDVAGDDGEKSAALNAAYAVLRDPSSRLKHLLELEWPGPAPSPGAIPPHLGTTFGRIAETRQRGRDLAAKEAAAQSPLARALLAGDRATYRRDLEATVGALAETETAALEDLRQLDALWEQRDEAMRDRLAAAQQHFAYLAKWQAQLREELFRLG